MFSCSGRKWLSEEVFPSHKIQVRLGILYPGDISQDFLVYQQSTFFFFPLFHNFPDLHFLSHLKILVQIPYRPKDLLIKRHYFLQQYINRL